MCRTSYRSPVFSVAQTWHVSPCVLGNEQILSAPSRVTILLFSRSSVLRQVHSCCVLLKLIFVCLCLCGSCGQLKCQVCEGWHTWPLWLSIGKEWRCWWPTCRSRQTSSPTDIPRSSSGIPERYGTGMPQLSFSQLALMSVHSELFSQRNACSPGWAAHGAPPPTSAISMQSAFCKHMVSLNSVTWEMSSFSWPSKTLQMRKTAVLEWTFSPPRKRPNNACNNTVSYRESNCIFQSHLLISIICAAVKSTHRAEWFLICDSRRFLFGCLCCRHTPGFLFTLQVFWPLILHLIWNHGTNAQFCAYWIKLWFYSLYNLLSTE